VAGVLVSGAGGFIGLPTIVRLAGQGSEVHALSTRAYPPQLPGVRWHRLDLFDTRSVDELVGELAPEQLIHLAWCTETGRCLHAPENVTWVERSLHLLRAFVRCGGRRAVMLGTCAEYDWSAVDGPFCELTSAPAPATLYGVAKDALRRVASAYLAQEEVELAWARPFFLYGPREAPARLVPSLVRALLAGHTVATGSDERVRDFMYVQDVADALVALRGSSVVGAVNIASGLSTTIGEIVDRIVELTGGGELVRRGALPDRPGEPRQLLADVGRLHDEVGYRSRWNLVDGLAATVSWWREHESAGANTSPTRRGRSGTPQRM